MGKMAEVKALYERRRRDGFEVVGVNFEDNRADDGTTGQSTGSALAPGIRSRRRPDATPVDRRPGLRGTPRLFLIDRDGILRWDGGPEELEKRITDLLDAPRRYGTLAAMHRSTADSIRPWLVLGVFAWYVPTGKAEGFGVCHPTVPCRPVSDCSPTIPPWPARFDTGWVKCCASSATKSLRVALTSYIGR